MPRSMWTYPWDVLDVGADRVCRDIAETAGLDGISLATSYHAGHFLQVRSPHRKAYFPEDGVVYFRPTAGLWEGHVIRPKPAELLGDGDVLDDLIRRRAAGGLAVSCWTVLLHNTRLGLLHPGAVTRNAFGDPNHYSLCPSHPDVRAYAVTLVADLTRRYRPDVVELESPDFMGFVHGFHHEKDALGLTAEDDLLLSLCFCPWCLTRAAAAGVDGEAARTQVRAWIVDACDRPVPAPRCPDLPAAGMDAFHRWPALHDYLRWRSEPVTSLVADIRDRAHADSRIVVIAGRDGWTSGFDLDAIGRHADGVILCAYDMNPAAVASLTAIGRAALGSVASVGVGFRLGYPETAGVDDLAGRVAAAVNAGADGLNFYNYGLVPAPRLGWIAEALSRAEKRP